HVDTSGKRIERDGAAQRRHSGFRMSRGHLQESVIVPSLRETRIQRERALVVALRFVPVPIVPEHHAGERIVRLGAVVVALQRLRGRAASLLEPRGSAGGAREREASRSFGNGALSGGK